MRYRLDIHTNEQARQERLEEDVRRGLTAWQKSLPPKYFYDRAGSLLFERITELPEYYPTRTEATLLAEIVPRSIGEILPDDIVEIPQHRKSLLDRSALPFPGRLTAGKAQTRDAKPRTRLRAQPGGQRD